MATACQSCTFFDDHKTNNGARIDDAGLCRYNPPVHQPSEEATGLWPIVRMDDWCGHHTESRAHS
jgi:hypothetical protein